MNNNETIDNFLYDEENEYTQANDFWDGSLPQPLPKREGSYAEREDEIDERLWVKLKYSDEVLTIYKYLHK